MVCTDGKFLSCGKMWSDRNYATVTCFGLYVLVRK